MVIAGYLLTADEEHSVHHDNIWADVVTKNNNKLHAVPLRYM